ncbi:hypothetical protein [Gordonia sp. DT101]|uniref:hypothetical protein n=1 Tax=Gordonia sp. DT101 TaxID=3416545 RepID=UPI003CF52541
MKVLSILLRRYKPLDYEVAVAALTRIMELETAIYLIDPNHPVLANNGQSASPAARGEA